MDLVWFVQLAVFKSFDFISEREMQLIFYDILVRPAGWEPVSMKTGSSAESVVCTTFSHTRVHTADTQIQRFVRNSSISYEIVTRSSMNINDFLTMNKTCHFSWECLYSSKWQGCKFLVRVSTNFQNV